MRSPFTPGKPVIDPRWNEYLAATESTVLASSAPREESARNRQLRDQMTEIISPWQFGEASSRETLIRLKRLADEQL